MVAHWLRALPDYPFDRLRGLLDVHAPGLPPIYLSVGEPQHPFPEFVTQIIAETGSDFARYPAKEGSEGLRTSIRDWLVRRYGLDKGMIDLQHTIQPLSGTREGLFNAGLTLIASEKNGRQSAVLIPNPFYQCYAAAALAAGARAVFVDATAGNGYLPDYAALPEELLARTSAVYICSPANPQGAMASAAYWRQLFDLADTYDFYVLADECYAEIYTRNAPEGALAIRGVKGDFDRVLAFHSLSKRSNVPGLRSGFAAGDPTLIAALRLHREYGGAPIPLPLDHAAAALWADDAHVEENRALYSKKFQIAEDILGPLFGPVTPGGGFFLWLNVRYACGLDGETAALRLWKKKGLRVLPGAYLGREGEHGNPGADYIRVALVHDLDTTEESLKRLAEGLTDVGRAQALRS